MPVTYALAGQYGAAEVLNSSGVPQTGHSVTVYVHGTFTLATLYTDKTMGTGAANPTTTDSLGNLTFFAAPGEYDIVPSGLSSEAVLVPADPGDPALTNAVSVGGITITGTPIAGYVPVATSGTAANWAASLANTDGTLTVAIVAGAMVASRPLISGDVTILAGSNSATVNAISGVVISGTAAAGKALIATSSGAAAWTAPVVIAGITISGTPAAGNLLQATSTSAASWATLSATTTTSLTGLITGTGANLGSVAAPSGTVVGATDTQTLTNKRITKRVLSLSANSATPAINTDNYDVVHITAQTTALTSLTTNLTGTPVDGDTLRISVTGTAAVVITWGASYESSTVTLPATTVTTARLDVGFFWNTATSKWRCVAVA